MNKIFIHIQTLIAKIRSFDLNSREKQIAEIFPYFCFLYAIELLYFSTKFSFIYGSNKGIFIGLILTMALCAVIISAYAKSLYTLIALIIICELHIAFSLVLIANSIFGSGISSPIPILLFRCMMLPFEILFSIAVIRFNSKSHK